MKRNGRAGRKRWLYGLVVVLVASSYGYWASQRTLPALQPIAAPSGLAVQTPAAALSWPASGQSAVGIVGTSILETHGPQTALPTASTAKLITALTVLQQKPLNLNEQGPTIILTAADVDLYNSYNARGGSVVPVAAGEQISEYQMLQALMLPSANNMADSLAIWAFGSLQTYNAAATSFLAGHGLTQTKVSPEDASGFAPDTVSTARELVKIGELAMQNQVLAQIVGQPTANGIPLANNIKNVNFLLGTANIVGIKTGNTDEAGGVFVSASRITVNNKPVTIVTALTGAPTLFSAVKGSLPLIQSAQVNFSPTPIITTGSIIGRYRVPWGGTVTALTSNSLNLRTWHGSIIPTSIHLKPIAANSPAGSTVGSLTLPKSVLADQQSVPLKLQTTPSKPSLTWRLLHP